MSTSHLRGTVSHGTLHPSHLIPTFAAAYATIKGTSTDQVLLPLEIQGYTDEETIEHLTDALNDAAPEGYYFGTHPGDGSDFGFWHDCADDSEHCVTCDGPQ